MMSHRSLLPILLTFLVMNDARAEGPEDSIVRVFASRRLPNPIRPWTKQAAAEVMGTGVVIDGNRILTNAHIVLYAGEVFVQPFRGGDRVVAKVASIGPGIDLATLELEDDGFFAKRPPMPRAANLPASNDSVMLIGFPVGGSGPAVSRGVISRIDYASYTDLTQGLQIQVDAVAGPGNSGGPAIVDGKMVGMVFRRAQNIGHVIPEAEIATYLEDVKDGRYDGKSRVLDRFQSLVNPALRKRLDLGPDDRGVMVRTPGRTDPAYPLREGDVLTHFGDSPVDNEGMVEYGDNLQLPFTALIGRREREGVVAARLIRDGEPKEVDMVVTREDDRLIKPYLGRYPSYFVHGPLVFSPVVEEAAAIYEQANPFALLGSPMVTRANDQVGFPGEELVVVTAPMMSHPITRGYGDPFALVVKDVDGIPIKNLRHLVEVLRDGEGEFLTIRFFGDLAETLVFPRKLADAATAELMAEHGIPRRGTDELMAVWQGQPAAGD